MCIHVCNMCIHNMCACVVYLKTGGKNLTCVCVVYVLCMGARFHSGIHQIILRIKSTPTKVEEVVFALKHVPMGNIETLI